MELTRRMAPKWPRKPAHQRRADIRPHPAPGSRRWACGGPRPSGRRPWRRGAIPTPARNAMISAEGSSATSRAALISGIVAREGSRGARRTAPPACRRRDRRPPPRPEAPGHGDDKPRKPRKGAAQQDNAENGDRRHGEAGPVQRAACCQIAGTRSSVSAGVSGGRMIPAASGSWLSAMIAAIPMVKPFDHRLRHQADQPARAQQPRDERGSNTGHERGEDQPPPPRRARARGSPRGTTHDEGAVGPPICTPAAARAPR